ncbi:trehalose-6-phosphate synthase [Desulfuromonas versatilis]|uniref:Trehalose-6-phosphate synthase n=1 Tax=Desulfuromonas versatilis TaxID=2802975 RepID=A0ABM8HNM7_9BACT|nr:trehalose-6-phosphate synthase [Desulfuromonas versatilis]BCR03065.1 trehalose-6-phosphate synthase [Desulfuromonas versatilis]
MTEKTQSDDKRLVVVSNRLPIAVGEEAGQWRIKPGSGGLVTALAPVIKARQGLWIGWPGCGEGPPLDELFDNFGREQGYRLAAVPLSEEEEERYYRGFSNSALWPLFHDLLGNCRFRGDDWQTYLEVNRRFADVVASRTGEDDLVWVQDYQLIMVGAQLRELGLRQKLAFFLHIPFPTHDLFRRLPWNREILTALLAYDLVGFQTLRDRRNFVNSAIALIPELQVERRQRAQTLIRYQGRIVRVGHFPISIDFAEFNDAARSQEVADAAWYLHENLEGRQVMLGVDRLDYTKGIPERFRAFERALEKYPDLHRNISLLQVVVPSRTQVPDYQDLKQTLDRLSGRINSRFGEPGWIPIHYVFRSLERTQLLAHYRTSEIALVTPLRDGMNLVAKEYCAASVENNGVLILSEFAGAADQLGKHALLVNPYDVEGTADAMHRAFTMPGEERRRRMGMLRTQVRRYDVHHWVRSFLGALSTGTQLP